MVSVSPLGYESGRVKSPLVSSTPSSPRPPRLLDPAVSGSGPVSGSVRLPRFRVSGSGFGLDFRGLPRSVRGSGLGSLCSGRVLRGRDEPAPPNPLAQTQDGSMSETERLFTPSPDSPSPSRAPSAFASTATAGHGKAWRPAHWRRRQTLPCPGSVFRSDSPLSGVRLPP
jgi:hypothetical protein